MQQNGPVIIKDSPRVLELFLILIHVEPDLNTALPE